MAPNGFVLSRRAFLGVAAGTLALPACLTDFNDFTGTSGGPRLRARPAEPLGEMQPGISQLDLGEVRDGFLYVPFGHDLSRPMPLLVLLHGAFDGSSFWTGPRFQIEHLADERGLVILALDSRSASWDVVQHHRFEDDPSFVNRALELTFSRCRIDPMRIGLAGFSDGGTTALSLGLPNGDLFSQLAAFSPGFVASGERIGKPGIFLSHGLRDGVFPVASSRNGIVPKLRNAGYQVEYQEFDGPHEVPVDKLVRVMDRLVG